MELLQKPEFAQSERDKEIFEFEASFKSGKRHQSGKPVNPI